MNADQMNPDVASEPETGAAASPCEWGQGIQIEECSPLDHLVVRTKNSVYDLVIASGHDGDVLVRGGRLFPDFRHARLVGATAGCSTVKLRGVYVGLSIEFFADGRPVITSPVTEISLSAEPLDVTPSHH